MGFCCTIYQISYADAVQIRRDPETVSSLLAEKGRVGLSIGDGEVQSMLFDLSARAIPTISYVELYKLWYGLDLLLNWGASAGGPHSQAILGGEEIGLGYSIKILNPSDVRTVSGALATLDHDEIQKRFDEVRSAVCQLDWNYSIFIEEEPTILLPALMQGFDRLTEIYRDGSRCGNALLIEWA